MLKQISIWFSNTPVGRIISVVVGFILISPYLDITVHRGLYTSSLLIKDILMFVLPLMIAVFVSSSLASFKAKAPLLIVSLLLFEFVSNASSVMYAYLVGMASLDQLQGIAKPEAAQGIEPFFSIGFLRPKFWSGDKGMFLGVVVGLVTVFWPQAPWFDGLIRVREAINNIFAQWISKLAPLFLVGFMSNMYVSGLGDLVNVSYVVSFGIATAALVIYVVFLYGVAAGFHPKQAITFMKNAFPSFMMALSTMCSITTMPYTIACAEKNLQNPALAKMIIPATTNIQQIGDCLLNAFFCIILLKTFDMPIPDFGAWLVFVGVFATARFATAGVLGGAIFVMMPIYERYLGFTPDMLAMIFALNVLFDPIVTVGNVYANGALCIVFEKFWNGLDTKFSRLLTRFGIHV